MKKSALVARFSLSVIGLTACLAAVLWTVASSASPGTGCRPTFGCRESGLASSGPKPLVRPLDPAETTGSIASRPAARVWERLSEVDAQMWLVIQGFVWDLPPELNVAAASKYF